MDLVHVVIDSHFKELRYRGFNCSLDELLKGGIECLMVNFSSSRGNIGDELSRKGYKVYGDSGGLQAARSGKSLDPASISDWYNENVVVGMCLDSIPVEMTSEYMSGNRWMGDDENVLREHARVTAENVEKMSRDREYDLRHIYQGRSWDQLSTWGEHVDTSKSDGLAIPMPSGYRYALTAIVYLWKHHYGEPIHFLGVGGPSRYVPLVLLDKLWPATISCDSSRSAWIARNRTLYNLTEGLQKLTLRGHEAAEYTDQLPCDCRFCETLVSVPNTLSEKDPSSKKSVFTSRMLIAHNILAEEKRARFLERLSQNVDHYTSYCRSQMKHIRSDESHRDDKMGVMDCLEGILMLEEDGVEATCKRYDLGQPKLSEWF